MGCLNWCRRCCRAHAVMIPLCRNEFGHIYGIPRFRTRIKTIRWYHLIWFKTALLTWWATHCWLRNLQSMISPHHFAIDLKVTFLIDETMILTVVQCRMRTVRHWVFRRVRTYHLCFLTYSWVTLTHALTTQNFYNWPVILSFFFNYLWYFWVRKSAARYYRADRLVQQQLSGSQSD